MPIRILRNERSRFAFGFGRTSALRQTVDTVDQLQAQLDAERKQHASTSPSVILDLMQPKLELASRNVADAFAGAPSH